LAVNLARPEPGNAVECVGGVEPECNSVCLIQEVERQFDVTTSKLFDVYVSCFCERRDQLSQWRGYSSTASGYALGFRSSCIGRMPGLLRRVVYDRDTQVMLVREAMNPLCQAMAGIPTSDAQRIVDLSISRNWFSQRHAQRVRLFL
jgi:hypothetical protein